MKNGGDGGATSGASRGELRQSRPRTTPIWPTDLRRAGSPAASLSSPLMATRSHPRGCQRLVSLASRAFARPWDSRCLADSQARPSNGTIESLSPSDCLWNPLDWLTLPNGTFRQSSSRLPLKSTTDSTFQPSFSIPNSSESYHFSTRDSY